MKICVNALLEAVNLRCENLENCQVSSENLGPLTEDGDLATAVTREEFVAVFDVLCKELVEEVKNRYEMPPHAVQWLDKVTLS